MMMTTPTNSSFIKLNPVVLALRIRFRLALGFASRNTLSASLHYTSHQHPCIRDKVRNMDDALHRFDEMIQRRPLPPVVQFTQLLNVVIKMKRFSESLRLFKQVCAVGVHVDQHLMNIAIKCCCRLHRTDEGFAVLGSNLKRGINITPDARTFSALLNGLIVENRIVEAEILFNKLIKHKLCELDVVMNKKTMIKRLCMFANNVETFDVLVNAFCKEGKAEEAEALINLMVERDMVPDVATYTSLIGGYCMRYEVKSARKVFDSMVSRNIVPSIITYNTLLDGYSMKWSMKEAMDLFDEIIRKGLKPSLVTYHMMIHTLLLSGLCKDILRIEEPVSWFHLYGRGKLNPDIDVYAILMDGAIKCGKFDTAKFLSHELTLKGLQPNIRMYTVMINGLLTEAKELFLKMDESCVSRNNVTYCVLLREFLKKQRYDDVETLLQEMNGKGYSLMLLL